MKQTFDLVQSQLALLCPHRSVADIALATRALWSGIHGVCVLGLDQTLQIAGGRSIEEVAGSLLIIIWRASWKNASRLRPPRLTNK